MQPYSKSALAVSFVFALAVLAGGLLTPQPASAEISFDAIVKTGFQAIEADQGASVANYTDQEPGFTTPTGDLYMRGEAIDGVDVFFKITNDAEDWGGSTSVNWDWGYITFTDVSPAFDIQVGSLGVGVGSPYRGFTDGPSGAMSNPVVGNSPIDIKNAANGIKILGSTQRFSWGADVNTCHFFDNFAQDRGFCYEANASFEITPQISVAGAFASTDGGGSTSVTGDDHTVYGPTGNNDVYLFDNGQGGGNGIANGDPAGVNGPAIETTVFEIAAQWTPGAFPFSANIWFTSYEDDLGQNSSGSHELTQYGIEGTWNLSPKAHLAARWNLVENDTTKGAGITVGGTTLSPTAGGGDELTRLQIGGGYKYNQSTLFKAEYVTQSEDQGSNLTDLGDDFDGIVGEVIISY